jgi:hypothetical protein
LYKVAQLLSNQTLSGKNDPSEDDNDVINAVWSSYVGYWYRFGEFTPVEDQTALMASLSSSDGSFFPDNVWLLSSYATCYKLSLQASLTSFHSIGEKLEGKLLGKTGISM